MAGPLFKSKDPERWQDRFESYWDCVEKSGKNERLPELDRWYRQELPRLLEDRRPSPHLTKGELVKLVEWKLARSKWRPRLLQYAKDAQEQAVREATAKALARLLGGSSSGSGSSSGGGGSRGPPSVDEVKAAMAEATVLKGVGPATASALLSALDASVSYMSDEAMEAALGSKDYTVPQFVRLLDALRGKAAELSAGAGERLWTARDVELCLFAEALTLEAGEEEDAQKGAQQGVQPPRKKRRR